LSSCLVALETRRRLIAMNEVTRILLTAGEGDPKTPDELLPLLYDELRRLAAQKLAREAPGQTLQATALVHEAYLRLVNVDQIQSWDSRGHFFAAAAEAMRRILIENARRKRTEKHGGKHSPATMCDVEIESGATTEDVLALDEALTKLAEEDPIKARLVNLRYFAGLSLDDAARALGISRATAYRHWRYAKVWLYCELHGTEPPPVSSEKSRDA
jgi:RNA polymerase sigma factor (TIGR02999 family)